MNKTPPIEWTNFTVNPFRFRNLETGKVGHHCSKISPGCKNCYSSTMQAGPYLSGLTFIEENKPKGEFFFDRGVLDQVLRRRKPAKIFWCDMTDMFLEDYPDEWIDQCFAVMALTPHLTHQVLTKRAARLRQYVGVVETERFYANDSRPVRIMAAMNALANVGTTALCWPLPNVWLGVSVEDQQRADERIPLLLQTPTALRFISAEPLLGPLDLSSFADEGLECNYCCKWSGVEADAIPDGNESDPGFICPRCGEACAHLPIDERLDWVIAGGESGPGARPCDMGWVQSLVWQCRAAGTPCFVKQLGAILSAHAVTNQACAAIILESIGQYGGEGSLPVQWARLVIAK